MNSEEKIWRKNIFKEINFVNRLLYLGNDKIKF